MALSPLLRLSMLREVNRARSNLLGEARHSKVEQGKAKREHLDFRKAVSKVDCPLRYLSVPIEKAKSHSLCIAWKKKKIKKKRKRFSEKCHVWVVPTIYRTVRNDIREFIRSMCINNRRVYRPINKNLSFTSQHNEPCSILIIKNTYIQETHKKLTKKSKWLYFDS